MITIKITGDTIEDAQKKFERFFYRGKLKLALQASDVDVHQEVAEECSAQPDLAPTQPQKRKRGRPPKVVKAQAKAVKEDEPKPLPTLEEVRTVVQKVIDRHGIPAAIKIVEGFGQARYSQIPKEEWPKFIEKCHEALT